ncbi:MAG: ABC transporter ATP-binding protein [Firmicutes bacterium]|nr:ABC transporter ATP-binding protein [Bacillota bacterium]
MICNLIGLLYKFLKPHWKAALLAPILMFIEVLANLWQPTLMAAIVDKGIATGDIAFIIHTGLKMIGVALLGVIGGIGCTITASIASQSFGADLREAVFKKVQTFSFANLDKIKTSSLITRLTNDVVRMQNVVLMSLRMLVRAPLMCIGGIVMAVVLNARLTLILLVAIPILLISLVAVSRRAFPLFAKAQQSLDRVNAIMQENLAGIRVVKAYVRSDREKARFGQSSRQLRDITVQASRIIAVAMPIMMLVMNFSIVAVIWLGGLQVTRGQMQVGEIMAYINYLTQILFSLLMVGMLFMMLSRAQVSAARVSEVLTTKVDIQNTPHAVDHPIKSGRVEFQNVSFRYPQAAGPPVLKNISFIAEPGTTVAILGATGAGKSTLVNLIPRLYEPTEGKVLIDKTDVRDIKLETLRGSIGMVLQEPTLFSGSIKDNIKWGQENASDEEVIAAAKVAQAHDFIMSLPEKYDTKLGQRGVNLSGGQKQRIAIARAVIKQPPILILDDSTSAVDMGTEARIQQALKKATKQSTCFIIAQRISAVLHADKIIVLEDGQIEALGTHEQLLKTSAVYQDIYRSQIREGADISA